MAEFFRADTKFINVDNVQYIEPNGELKVKVFIVRRETSLKLTESETAEFMKNVEFKGL